jgi:glutamyl-tRNA synthetase
MDKKVRVRFAPSPTGGLHLGGVRTVLFNYLFAKQHGGDFILRIEDTDQNRFIEGAEQYIIDCLEWCGLIPDEAPHLGGPFAPYRQSERKSIYLKYAEQLIQQGNAYYAFDTTEELDVMRSLYKTEENPSPQYNYLLREKMSNSLTMDEQQLKKWLADGVPYVIRIKLPKDDEVRFTDMIRGEVSFSSNAVDDKVLIKADGMPTYHLAVVIDDYLMKITHAFRGEEWLPSTPVHILLWKYLGWEAEMPQWAHLPLILKPDGHGKLSKRDADRLGFPVFAMNWQDPVTNEIAEGFREKGFLPEAFVNMLAMLGWNDGSGQEIFTLTELIERFSIDRVHKGGAKFDFEKAKWFNHEWIKKYEVSGLRDQVREVFRKKNIEVNDELLLDKVITAVKDRCHLLTDFIQQGSFFFSTPASYDLDAVRPKWNNEKNDFFSALALHYSSTREWEAATLENEFKQLAIEKKFKPGELQLPLRIMLVGGKFGPPVFEIAAAVGKEETINRINKGLAAFSL